MHAHPYPRWVLAYVFWHRPAAGVDADAYEAALAAFHTALAAHPPHGFGQSAAFRLDAAPWLPGDGPAYEDWYAVESWEALGRLNDAAVTGERAAPHDAVAFEAGAGAGGVYRLLAGQGLAARAAAWLHKPGGEPRDAFHAALTATGGAVWMRQMVLGPAPEYVVRADEVAELPWRTTPIELVAVA
jgi:hypothetical protein